MRISSSPTTSRGCRAINRRSPSVDESKPIKKNERNKMKTGKLTDQLAVVTGASKGIGAGIARHLAAEGATVVVNYASSKDGADQVVDQIAKRGGKAIAIQADVAKKKDVERLFAETKKAFGR